MLVTKDPAGNEAVTAAVSVDLVSAGKLIRKETYLLMEPISFLFYSNLSPLTLHPSAKGAGICLLDGVIKVWT